MSKLIMALWVVVMLALAACGTGSPTAVPTQPAASDATEQADDAPGDAEATAEGAGNDVVDTVRTFIQASYENDMETVSRLYCDAISTNPTPDAPTLTPGIEFDLSGLTFTVVEETADTAQVQVEGTITTNMDIAGTITSTDLDFAPITYDLVNEDGWKICSGGS